MQQVRDIYVIGYPVNHSLSPLMHNRCLRSMDLPFDYQAKEIKPEQLQNFCQEIKTNKNCIGFNVTIPHKETILPYLDYLSPMAKKIGAVNTVVKNGSRLLGYNTDAQGYLISLLKAGFNPQGKSIVILGAGGSARAVSHILASSGASQLCIVNRTIERAQLLVDELANNYSDVKFAMAGFSDADLLINCTSLGLNNSPAPNIPWDLLKNKILVSDLVYRPRITAFLQAAINHGHKVLSGEGMLAYQGALAFSLWTGKPSPFQEMQQQLISLLA